MSPSPPRIAITGLGVVSPLGIGADAFRAGLLSGATAIGTLRGIDPSGGSRLGAQVGDLPARDVLPAPLLRRMDRLSQMIATAGAMAVRQAGLAGERGDDLGIVVGSALGNLSESAQFLERAFRKPAAASPMLFPNLVLNAPASQLAMAFDWRGPNLTLSQGEISGEAALEAGVALLRRRRARAVLVAAGDELSAVVHRALSELRVLSPRGAGREWSSPFDRGANGPVAGEGAAALVLESEAAAAGRGARPLAIVEDVRRTAIAGASPHLWPAGAPPLEPDAPAIDLVFSGADSSPERDALELSLLAAYGGGRRPPLYAWKGAAGEFGSAGLTGVAAAALCLVAGALPPQPALERPRREAEGHRLEREGARGDWRSAIVLGTARGGACALVRVARAE